MKTFKQKEREFALTRAESLKGMFPEAKELLEFAECVLRFQGEVIDDLSGNGFSSELEGYKARIRNGKPALNLRSFRWESYSDYMSDLLERVHRCGTAEVREGVERVRGEGLSSLLDKFFDKRADSVERVLSVSFMQPILYVIAGNVVFKHKEWLRNTCPVCGSKPSVSFLMDTEDWEGARFLRCSLCLTDWLYTRTTCAVCGNNDDNKLHYFVTQEIKHIEVQVCGECNHYIKLIDLRKDGFAVPDLDDLASVSLDLWAGERGYIKVEKNLLGF